MVFKAAGMIKNEMDKHKAKKEFEGKSGMITVDLKEEIRHLKQFNFKDQTFQFLNVTHWIKDPVELMNLDLNILSKLNWYDTGAFEFTILPLIIKSINGNICLRMLTRTNRIDRLVSFDIYSEGGEEVFLPEEWKKAKASKMHVAPGKLLMFDISMESFMSASEGFIGVLLALGPVVLTTRLKLLTDGKEKKAKDYLDLVEKRFFGLVDLPYVVPGGARQIIRANMTKNYWKVIKEKKAEKIGVGNLDQPNPVWLADYTRLSEFWG